MQERVRHFLDLGAPPGGGVRSLIGELCSACGRALPVDGVSVSGAPGLGEGVVVASDGRAEAVGRAQLRAGEGPGLDAQRLGTVVAEPDLARSDRWPGFRDAATAAGVAAAFAFPLRVGRARFGSLELLANHPGPLSPTERADAMVAADVAASLLLAMAAGVEPDELSRPLALVGGDPSSVHQAAGMAAVQLGTTIEEAYVALRARAHDDQVALPLLADELVRHAVTLEGTRAGPTGGPGEPPGG